eukprot:COSAG01_NODE_13091_length_1636_cov_19.631100_2_plen_236_part_00
MSLYETQLDYVLGNARGRAVVKNCRVKKSHQINRHGEQFDHACLECKIKVTVGGKRRKGQKRQVVSELTEEQSEEMQKLFETAMGEVEEDPELDMQKMEELAMKAPRGQAEGEMQELKDLLTKWMRGMQQAATEAFDKASRTKQKTDDQAQQPKQEQKWRQLRFKLRKGASEDRWRTAGRQVRQTGSSGKWQRSSNLDELEAAAAAEHTPLMHWAKHTSPGPEWRRHSSTSRART